MSRAGTARDRVPAADGTRPRQEQVGFLSRNWLACCALALMVASDYKFRVRPPTSTLSGGADAFVLAEVIVYGIVAGYLLWTQERLPRLRRTETLMFFSAAYVAVICVAAAYSPFRSLATVRAFETVVLICLVGRMRSHATREDLHRLAHGFLLLVAGSVLLGLAHPMPAVSPQQVGRFTWLQVHPITSGVYLGLAALVAVVYVSGADRDRPGPVLGRRTYAALLALVLLGLLATKTRNAVLAFGVGAVVLLWSRVRGRARVVLTVQLLVAVGLAAMTLGPVVTSYFARGEDAAQLASLNSRTSLWSDAFQALRLQPLFGYGLSASRGIFLDATGLGGGHNAFVNVAVDLGLVGLVLWLGILAQLILTLARTCKAATGGCASERALLLGIVTFLLIDGFFFEGMGAVSNVAADWLFFSVGWALVLQRAPSRDDLPRGFAAGSAGSGDVR